MGLLKRLFGSKSSAPEAPGQVQPPQAPQPPQQPAAKGPDVIKAYDAYGRELFVPRDQWRTSVLPGQLKKVWDDPEALYGTIVQALRDGFNAEMVEPAEHLAAIDPNAERGAVVLANVYREQKRMQDSERVLRQHLERHGESGPILSNLAKVQTDRAEQVRTLWRSLELDPNQDHALAWYEAIQREKGGPAASLEALRRLAALPGSWRARAWLGRAALEARDLPAALDLFREALAMADVPAPADLLLQVSGDLGKAGHLPELLSIATLHFIPEVHGLAVGNNLIKAYVDLGKLDPASELVQQLYNLNRPDWKQGLGFWETEIAKARTAAQPVDPAIPMNATMLVTEGPVWLPEPEKAKELFPAPDGEPLRVAFLGGTAETGATAQQVTAQMSDGPGRLSRALPLFLAEQAQMGAGLFAQSLQPWLLAPHCGFILSGVAWADDEAAAHARQTGPANTFVVTIHLRTSAAPWQVELRLIRTEDAACLGTAQASFAPDQPEAALTGLSKSLLQLLAQHGGAALRAMPEAYQVPGGNAFGFYLLRLEQLLAVRCARIDGTPANYLSGEREILDGDLQLCLAHPKNPTARLLLFQTCLSMKRSRPAIVAAYRERLERLQREHPIPAPAEGILQGLLDQVFAEGEEDAQPGAGQALAAES